MDDLATQQAFDRAERQLEAITGVKPELLAADRHPRYRSAPWAQRHADGRPVLCVQHHHAHIAAVMAEHGLDGAHRVIGVAFDGTGYGDDGAVWGGEFLLADYDGYHRFAHLAEVPLPGGDAAVRRPYRMGYRMALSHLRAAGIDWAEDLACVAACPPEERRLLARQLELGLNCVPTSSMGRLFDAVSSLAGVCQLVGYEAQAAIELEGTALNGLEPGSTDYEFALDGAGPTLAADPGPLLAAAVADLRAGLPAGVIAARFRMAVAGLVRRVCTLARERCGLSTVAPTGGVFANSLLSSACAGALRADGFTVLRHHRIPPNDGGLAFGQLMVTARLGTPPQRSE